MWSPEVCDAQRTRQRPARPCRPEKSAAKAAPFKVIIHRLANTRSAPHQRRAATDIDKSAEAKGAFRIRRRDQQ